MRKLPAYLSLFAFCLPALAAGPSVDSLIMGLEENVAISTGARGREPSYGGGLAAGFIAGIAALQEGREFCPESPKPIALLAAVRNYLLDHPGPAPEGAAAVVSRALAMAFPCSAKSGGAAQ